MMYKTIAKISLAIGSVYGVILLLLFTVYIISNSITSQNSGEIQNETRDIVPTEINLVKYTNNFCAECGAKCVEGKEIPSTGDIISRYNPYYICGSTECINSRYNRVMEVTGRNEETSFRKTGDSRYLQGSDGRIYEKDVCGLCDGTGYESNRYGYVRLCSMCQGKGHRNY